MYRNMVFLAPGCHPFQWTTRIHPDHLRGGPPGRECCGPPSGLASSEATQLGRNETVAAGGGRRSVPMWFVPLRGKRNVQVLVKHKSCAESKRTLKSDGEVQSRSKLGPLNWGEPADSLSRSHHFVASDQTFSDHRPACVKTQLTIA